MPRYSLSIVAALALVIILTGCPNPPPLIPPVGPPPHVEGAHYTIQPGDTVFSIAKRHGVDWHAMMDANPSLDPGKLVAGQVIVIPGATGVILPTPGVPQSPLPAANPGHPGPIAAESHLVWPLEGEIIGKFHQPMPWRMKETNYGIDIRATPNEAVVAAKSGRVNIFADLPGYGKVVILHHTDNSVTFYGHLDEILCTHGTWVRQGETIGAAGATGWSSGTELHFRVMQGDHFVDPLPLLR